MDGKTFVLSHDEARRRARDAVIQAPDGIVVELRPPKRTLAQNAMLHGLLTKIAAVKPWAGALRSVSVWKRLMMASWMRARGDATVEMLPALDGHGVDIVYAKSSELDPPEMSELLEYVRAYMAEEGIDE